MKYIRWLPVLLLAAALAGCAKEEPVPETTAPPVIEKLTITVTEEDIRRLDSEYPDLKEVNFGSSTCYEAMKDYRNSHPEVKVTYTVPLGDRAAVSSTRELTLKPGTFAYETLKRNLQYLPELRSLCFAGMELTADQFGELADMYPDVGMTYTVTVGDTLCGMDTETLDLSWVEPEQVEEIVSRLSLLPGLTQVELMAGEESRLGIDDVVKLQEAAPQAVFHYTFTLFGKTVTTTDEEMYFQYQRIGDSGEEELRRALKLLHGTRVVLDTCHFSSEVLAQVREDYRDNAKLVWRVWFGKNGSCLTDREVIRAVYGLTDSNSQNLKYCEDARFLDFGHDEYLRDAGFVAYMPKLEAIILSGSMVSDLTPFENCRELVFLELAYCGYLEDLSPLANCPKLSKVNVSFTKVSDLSALDSLPMDTLCATGSKVDAQEQTRFTQLHPDCLVQFRGDNPYSSPWRYTDDGKANEYYGMLRKVFDYDHAQNTTW